MAIIDKLQIEALTNAINKYRDTYRIGTQVSRYVSHRKIRYRDNSTYYGLHSHYLIANSSMDASNDVLETLQWQIVICCTFNIVLRSSLFLSENDIFSFTLVLWRGTMPVSV